MSARDGQDDNNLGQGHARRSVRLSKGNASKPEYDLSRHPQDEELQSSDDASSESQEASASATKPKGKAKLAKPKAKAKVISLVSDEDSDDVPLKKTRASAVKTKPTPATVESEADDSEDEPLKPKGRSAARPRPNFTASDKEDEEIDSDEPIVTKRKAKTNVARQSRADQHSDDELLVSSKGKGGSKMPSSRAVDTGKISRDKQKRPWRPGPVKRRQSHELPEDFIVDSEDFAAVRSFAPSITLPTKQQDLLDMRMNNLDRLQRTCTFPIPKGGEPAPEWQNAVKWVREIGDFVNQKQRDWRCVKAEISAPKTAPGTPKREPSWRFGFKDFGSIAGSKSAHASFEPRSLNNIPPGCFVDKSQAQALGDRICQYLNRWPVPIPSAATDDTFQAGNFWPVIAFTAFFDVWPNHDNSIEETRVLPAQPVAEKGEMTGPQFFVGVQHQKASGKPAKKGNKSKTKTSSLVGSQKQTLWKVRTSSVLYEEDGSRTKASGKVSPQFSVMITAIDTSIPIPDIPDWWPVNNAAIPAEVAADQRASMQHAIKLMGWVSYRMCGAIGNSKQQQAAAEMLKRPFLKKNGTGSRPNRGVYGGKALALWQAVSGEKIHIRSSNRQIRWPYIILQSLSKTLAAFVIEAMTQKYLSGDGLKRSYIYAALIADLLNNGKITKEQVKASVLACEEQPHQDRPHHCQRCLKAGDCRTMKFTPEGYRICQLCAEKGVHLIVDEATGVTRLIELVRSIMRNERKATKDGDYPITNEMFDTRKRRIIEVCKQVFNESELAYEDAYAKGVLRKDRSTETNSSGRSQRIRNPFVVSVDATLPVAEYESKLGYHTPNNTVPTALYLNLAKHMWVPAILQVLKDHRLLIEESLDESRAEVQQIYAKLDHIYVLSTLR